MLSYGKALSLSHTVSTKQLTTELILNHFTTVATGREGTKLETWPIAGEIRTQMGAFSVHWDGVQPLFIL